MCKKLVFLLMALGFCLSPTVQAANIIWVAQTYDVDEDGVQDDQGWVDWLVAEGHDVDVELDIWKTLDDDKIARLNAADLVIVSRGSNSGSYDDGDEPTLWNAVTTPIILSNTYICRNSRWKWVDSKSIKNLTAPPYEVMDVNHPVFADVPLVSLDPGDPNDPNAPAGPAIYVIASDPNVGTGQTSYIGSFEMGSGTLLAQVVAEETAAAIAEWEKGAEFYEGSGQAGAGHRMLFAAGTQESGPTPQGAFNLLPDGEIMFRNAIDYMVAFPYRYATDPIPADGASDLLRDEIVLSWTAGSLSTTRDVYLGTNMDDVAAATVDNPLDVLVSAGQEGDSYTPARLAHSETYYWRVDEVGPEPDFKIYRGDVWSFTVEPNLIQIDNITATASSAYSDDLGVERTIDGSGLDENDLHSADGRDMWLSDAVGDPAWVLYEFDNTYKVDHMLLWNSNTGIEPDVGYGPNDVTIEYSVDGAAWITLGDVQLAQAPGIDGLAAQMIDLGIGAKAIRLAFNNNHGGDLRYGLSEVRFLYIPVKAREPQPADGAVDVPFDVTLKWRSGLLTDVSEVVISAGRNNVVANAPFVTHAVTGNSFGPLGLAIGTTYYWKVNEVNDALTPSYLDGDIWSFATQDYFVVDDFESYGDISGTWKDGVMITHGSSSTGDPSVEQVVAHSGAQSMLLSFDNAKAPYIIEAERSISGRQDWTDNGVRKLVLSFMGDPGNSPRDRLYVKINGRKITYGGDLSTPWWQNWSIDLAGHGINITKIHTLTIGIGDIPLPKGDKGKVYIDDIRLYRSAPSVPHLVDALIALNADGQFDTLLAAVLAADPALVEELSSEGAFTVFAPTNDAFAALGIDAGNVGDLDEATLNDILLYHIAPGKLMADDVLVAEAIEMVAGGSLGQADGILTDNTGRQAAIIATDGEASNGVIHVIDTVVLPYEIRNIVEMLNAANSDGVLAGQLNEIIGVIEGNAALLDLLTGDDENTVFAPTDAAIAALRVDPDDNLFLYHIAAGTLLADEILAAEQIEMLNGGIVQQDGGVLIDVAGRQVALTVVDIVASNGAVHVIDAVLMPIPVIENASFELPGTDKQKGFDLVPGWATDANVVDSGVETGWTPTDGEWTAYQMGGDPAMWQMTPLTLAPGDLFTLKVDARITWAATTLRMTLYYEAEGVRVPAATADITLTEEMQEYALELNAYLAPEAVGKTIGVEFENVSGPASWIGLDNVRLEGPTVATEPEPEPEPEPVTYSFDDLPAGSGACDGVHAGIDFGTGDWWGGDDWYGVTQCGYFSDHFVDVPMSFTLPANAHLLSIVVSAEAAYSYTISDGVNADIVGTAGTTPEVINTNWTSGGSTITITTEGGWEVVFDDITYITSD